MGDLDFEVKFTTNGKPGDVAIRPLDNEEICSCIHVYQRKNLKLKKGDRLRAKADERIDC